MVMIQTRRHHLNQLLLEPITEAPLPPVPPTSLGSTIQKTQPILQHRGGQKACVWRLPSHKEFISWQGSPHHSSHSQAVLVYTVTNLLHETSTQQSQFWSLEPLSSSVWQNVFISRSSFLSAQCPQFPQLSLLWDGPRLLDHLL